MARKSSRPWKWLTVRGVPVLPYKARFSWKGQRPIIATGSRTESEAAAIADREYLAVLNGTREVAPKAAGGDLVDIAAEFIVHLFSVLPAPTVKVYRCYVKGWVKLFGSLPAMLQEDRQLEYQAFRLGRCMRKTHRKERTLMVKFFEWCRVKGYVRKGEAPKLPELGDKKGVRTGKQRENAVQLTLDEVQAIIANMPLVSVRLARRKDKRPHFLVRTFFEFLYETGLRPITVKRLRLGDNWVTGQRELIILNAQDKVEYGRTLPLSERAIAILEEVSLSGSLFGFHDLRSYPKAAARAAGLPEHKAKDFGSYDFRHARLTHLIQAGAPLTAAAYIAGHKQVTTTNRYVHANKNEAAKWI